MSSGGLAIYFVIWLAIVVAGYFVGKSKNRPAAGILWTFFLGLIGLLIVALLPRKTVGF